MTRDFEVRWEGELPAPPEVVWDGFTAHTDGWLWRIEYEPRVGGRERGLAQEGGTVTAWDPPRHFRTRSTDGGTFNQLDYRLDRRGSGSFLRYVHTGVLGDDDYDVQLDACEQHTAFYYHSLGEYVRHFPGCQAVYMSVDAPPASSAPGGGAAVRRALGVPDDVAAGDSVRLALAGIEPIDGVVDYVTDVFLGVRSADALHRVYGRDEWGWPVGVAHHLFGPGVDQAAVARSWGRWLDDVFADTEVA
jgi:hypothetical protein